VLDNKALRLSY